MAAKTEALRRDVDRLKGLTSGPSELRPLFHLHSELGHPVRYVTLDEENVELDDIQPSDVIFKMTDRLFNDLNSGSRYVVLEGGRGSGKSTGIGMYFLARAIAGQEKILCLREIQISLRESVKGLLDKLIRADQRLIDFFDIQRDTIAGKNGSAFFFRGLRDHTADAVRSFEGATLAWCEESQTVSRLSLDTLTPTIRESGSQIFFSMNRRYERDPVYVDFIVDGHPLARVGRFNLVDNPFAPQTLRDESRVMKERNPERWNHVYGGEILTISELRIFDNFTLLDFDIEEVLNRRLSMIRVGMQGSRFEREERRQRAINKIRKDFFVGLDPGFTDPSALVLAYIDPKPREMFIVDERYQAGLSPREIARMVSGFLKAHDLDRWPVTIDSARPEIREELNRYYGLNINSAKKTKVIDGIDALKNWRIFIHPRCENVAREFAMYSWRQNQNGESLPIPEDKHNHTIDALRYGVGNALDVKGGEYAVLHGVW